MDQSAGLRRWLQSPLPLKPVYYVLGGEGFLISEIKKTLIRHIHKNKGVMDFNHNEEDAAAGLSAEKLISLVETLPFMSEKRLALCAGAERLSGKDWERLAPYIENPVSSAVLVFFFN